MFGGWNDTCRKLGLLEVELGVGGGSSTGSGAVADSEAGRGQEDAEEGCGGAGEPWPRGAGSWGTWVCWLPAASPGPRPPRFVSLSVSSVVE